MIRHDQTPEGAQDGDRFVCSHCGYASIFVVLDDGQPGEWVYCDDVPIAEIYARMEEA